MKERYTEGATRTARNLIEAVSDVNAKGGAILVFLHKSVDGDCIGSACGICQGLRTLGRGICHDARRASREDEFP